MRIKYLGTAAAEGVPAMFCKCPVCQKIKLLGGREIRTRTQVLIDGCLSVDFPPEAYSHALKFGFCCADITDILVTHSHMDHFYAHDFILRGYRYAEGFPGTLNIYGNAEVAAVFSECTRREMKPVVAPNIAVHVLQPYRRYAVGGYDVLTLPANHGKREQALLFCISRGGKGYLHLYDTGEISSDAIAFLAEKGAKADVVSFDCTFLDAPPVVGTRHMCIATVAGIRERLLAAGVMSGGTRSVITHFSHNANPTPERLAAIEKKYSVTAAYDGMVIDI